MPQGADGQAIQIDRFFAGPGRAATSWRSSVEIAEAGDRAKFDAALGSRTEAFHAYPGPQLLAALPTTRTTRARSRRSPAASCAPSLTGAYRQNAGEWTEQEDESAVTPTCCRRRSAARRDTGPISRCWSSPAPRDTLARARHRMAAPAPPSHAHGRVVSVLDYDSPLSALSKGQGIVASAVLWREPMEVRSQAW